MKYTTVTFDALGRIRLPWGAAIKFNWGDFASGDIPQSEPIPPTTLGEALAKITREALCPQPAAQAHVSEVGFWPDLPIDPPVSVERSIAHYSIGPMKRPQRGGVPKGRNWTRIAAEHLHTAGQFNNGAGHPFRYFWLRTAAFIIHQHSRSPATRAEAGRLLTLLEAKR